MSLPIRRLYDLAESCVFVKQSVNAIYCDSAYAEHPFSRSYGANVPSSLERALSRAYVHLHSPTCVGLRYGHLRKQQKTFLGRKSGNSLWHKASATSFVDIDAFLSTSFFVLAQVGAGILACCASITPYGLILAPD